MLRFKILHFLFTRLLIPLLASGLSGKNFIIKLSDFYNLAVTIFMHAYIANPELNLWKYQTFPVKLRWYKWVNYFSAKIVDDYVKSLRPKRTITFGKINYDWFPLYVNVFCNAELSWRKKTWVGEKDLITDFDLFWENISILPQSL